MTSRARVRRARRAFELLLACACFSLCLSGSRLTHAQGNQAAAGSTTPDGYKNLIEQALLEFRHKNWPEARILFRRAHEMSPSARTLRGMGVVSYEMRDYVQAVRDLSAALADARQPLSAEQRSEAETLLSRARTFVAVYTVGVDPENAVVALDGSALVRESDGVVLLPFGEHTLSASLEGYETARTQVSVQGGERGEVTLALVPQFEDPKPVAAAAQPLALQQEPFEGPDGPEPEAARTGGLRYTWLGLGSAALFGGATVAFWVLGQNDFDNLDAKCKQAADTGMPCTSKTTDTESVERLELLTNISLGATAVAVVATGVIAYFEWPRTGERQLSVGLGPTSMSVSGAF